MHVFKIILERIPMVWFLLGLLFIAGGLYLGFDRSFSFVYIFVGLFCSLYGLVLFLFQLRERPRYSAPRPLSPNFISAGSTVVTPVAEKIEDQQETAPTAFS